MIARLLPLFLLAASVGVFFLFIDPIYDAIGDHRLEEIRLNEALTQTKELQKVRDELLAKRNAMSEEDLARLLKLLPDHVDNVRVIIDIDDIALRYGMTISDLNINAPADANKNTTAASLGADGSSAQGGRIMRTDPTLHPLGSVELTFKTSASYAIFLRFLRDLEQSLRIVDLVSLTFAAEDFDFYDFNVTIRTYWLR